MLSYAFLLRYGTVDNFCKRFGSAMGGEVALVCAFIVLHVFGTALVA